MLGLVATYCTIDRRESKWSAVNCLLISDTSSGFRQSVMESGLGSQCRELQIPRPALEKDREVVVANRAEDEPFEKHVRSLTRESDVVHRRSGDRARRSTHAVSREGSKEWVETARRLVFGILCC